MLCKCIVILYGPLILITVDIQARGFWTGVCTIIYNSAMKVNEGIIMAIWQPRVFRAIYFDDYYSISFWIMLNSQESGLYGTEGFTWLAVCFDIIKIIGIIIEKILGKYNGDCALTNKEKIKFHITMRYSLVSNISE